MVYGKKIFLYKCIILCIWKQAQVPLINNLCSTYMHKSTKKKKI